MCVRKKEWVRKREGERERLITERGREYVCEKERVGEKERG